VGQREVGLQFDGLGKRQAKLGGSCQMKVLIVVKDRKPCSRPLSVREQSRALKLGQTKTRAVAFRELGSASLRQLGVASLSRMVKPASTGKNRSRAPVELPGVVGDSARRRNHRELGRPVPEPCRNGADNTGWEAITRRVAGVRASDGPIVAWIRRLSRRGAKGPWPETS
jgi:hypothetical protein